MQGTTERSYIMTERMVENRVRKLQELEAQQKALEAEADAIRSELKAELEELQVEELKTKNFIIRWKEIISSRLDSKALKAELPEIFQKYSKQTSCRRFTVA